MNVSSSILYNSMVTQGNDLRKYVAEHRTMATSVYEDISEDEHVPASQLDSAEMTSSKDTMTAECPTALSSPLPATSTKSSSDFGWTKC